MEFSVSHRQPLPGATVLGPADPDEPLEVTLYLRRRNPLPPDVKSGQARLTRAELRENFGADEGDVEAVRAALEPLGVDVVAVDAGARRVVVAGRTADVARAFGTELQQARLRTSPRGRPVAGEEHTEQVRRYRTGPLSLPDELSGVVTAVLGLDDRPQARAHFRTAAKKAGTSSFTPPQVGKAYGFPAGADGAGRTLALIELGGGYAQSDLDAYFQSLGIATPSVQAVSVDQGSNTPTGDPNSADGEVMLDIEVAGSLAPGAKQMVYFAPNTDQGFTDAVSQAAHAEPTPDVISISWGGPEDSWTAQGRTALDQACADAVALGVTVLAAAGDNGSGDGESDGKPHCDFPASSPNVLGCGGTSLILDATGAIAAETVWNDGSGGGATGGGISADYPVPSWQTAAGVPGSGRGVPDVAGNADPGTGYEIRVDGQSMVIGGTSAVAPLWAALLCLLAQQSGSSFGLVQAVIYKGVAAGRVQPGFRDITSGGNGAYSAAAGWDPCTGLGSPDAPALGSVL
ncbi:MAG TPA: S53 family peptidase [Actinocrinis sp.]|jgi:kumamolisin